jgi:hypothetical protein
MATSRKGMSLKATTALVVIIFLLGFGGVMWYYAIYKVAFVQAFDVEVETTTTRHIGFNADPTLHFGMIPADGGMARKQIRLSNDWEVPLLVQIRVSGDAAQFIKVEDNDFIIIPGEARKISVYATVPRDFGEVGIYKGTAKVMYIYP